MLSPLQGSGRRFDPPRAVLEAAASNSSPVPFPVVVAAPAQVVIPEGATAEEALAALSASGLSPPLLAKPLHAGTTACGGSHALALLDDVDAVAALAEGRGLPHWRPPVVLQPYVRHPTPLFKVFVMGPLTVVARRPSLRVPPPPGDVNVSIGGAHAIARVSAYVSAEDGAEEEENGGEGESGDGNDNGEASSVPRSGASSIAFFEAPDPPQWALEALAAHLRSSMGLNLFNFDLITVDKTTVEEAAENGGGGGAKTTATAAPPDADFLVIDINYFPGFEKLPDYEGLLIEFLGWLFRPRTAERIRGSAAAGAEDSSGAAAAGAAAAAATTAEDLEAKLRVGTTAAAAAAAAAVPASSFAAASAPASVPPSTPCSSNSLPVTASAPLPPSGSGGGGGGGGSRLLATASSAGSSPLRGADSAASLQKLARSLSQRPVSFSKVGVGGGGGGISAAAAAAVARRDAEEEKKE